MAAEKPPSSTPLLMGDVRMMNLPWSAFFDAMARRMLSQDAEIAALKARLTAAGIA